MVSTVQHFEWAAPILSVKSDGHSVKICGDDKVTVNHEIQADSYLLPKTDDLFSKLASGEVFSKIEPYIKLN